MVAEIREITFEDIAPLWRELWVGNEANVKPANTATYKFVNGYNPKIPYGPVTFFGLYVDEVLCGGVSTYRSSPTHWTRIRGLYVQPSIRGHGYGQLLVRHVLTFAHHHKTSYVWGYPRCSSWSTYKACGFVQQGLITEFDFGPHVWAYHTL
jgi:GNAT superfamily N-acetyltransferase